VSNKKLLLLTSIFASLHVVNAATVRCYKHGAAGPWQAGDTHHW